MSKVRIIVSFSGGKDSQATLIYAVNKYGAERVEAIFCDTGWEHPVTYKHIEDVCHQLGVHLITLRNTRYGNFQNLCIETHCFPIPKKRICTGALKIQPMIDWILAQDSSMIILQGIRAGESQSRSKLDVECSFFKEYFEDTTKTLYRKRDVKAWCKTHDASVFRPVFKWTAQQVIDYILENNQRPNPLYERGASRVGCFPCIMSRQAEVRIVAKDDAMRERLITLEAEVNKRNTRKYAGFFQKGAIPERFCRTLGDGSPTAQEVIDYVTRYDDMPDLFGEEAQSCMSLYHGLCE